MDQEQQSTSREGQRRFEVLGKYRLIARLGHGGMADVFLAVALGPAAFNKLVVVKRLRSVVADSEKYILMFLDEAKLSARLNHPNIVHTYEVGENEDAYFIVMEYLDGQPLNHIVRAAHANPGAIQLPRGGWLRILANALNGLHYAHELSDYDGAPLGIVHRDVSPHNIFVTYDGTVKLVDFGIAKAALNSIHTETGIFKGKVSYMSPEQALASKGLDRRADIFAAGVVLWELLAGKRLFSGDAANSLHRLLHEPVPRLTTVVPDIPPPLEAIVTRALQRDPANRFATALEMRQAIEEYLRISGEDVTPEQIGASVQSLFEERRASLRQQIREQLDRATRDQGSDGPRSLPPSQLNRPSVLGTTVSLPVLDVGSGSGVAARVRGESDVSSLAAAMMPARSSKRGYVLGAIGLSALAALVIVGLQWTRAPAAAPPAAPASTASPLSAAVGVLTINTDPPAAQVLWNGQALGKTPLKVDLPAGTQSVVLSSPGFLDETLVVMVPAAGMIERSVALRPAEANEPHAAEPAAHAQAPSAAVKPRANGGGVARPAPGTKPARPEAVPPTGVVSAPPAPPPRQPIQIVGDEKPMVDVRIIH